jgi:hypothetical protein
MPGVVLLVAAVVTNVFRWKRGKTTICQFVREHVPMPVAATGLVWFFAWFPRHLLGGYRSPIRVTPLTMASTSLPAPEDCAVTT